MKLYRIYTENTGQTPEEVAKLLKAYGFDGATILYGMGIYKGQVEKTLILEIAGEIVIQDENAVHSLYAMIYNMLAIWKQQSIMVVHPDNTVEFVKEVEK